MNCDMAIHGHAAPPPPAARGTPIPRPDRSGAKMRRGAPAVVSCHFWLNLVGGFSCDTWKKSIYLFSSIHETLWNPHFLIPCLVTGEVNHQKQVDSTIILFPPQRSQFRQLPHLRLVAVPASCGLPDKPDALTYRPGLWTSHFICKKRAWASEHQENCTWMGK